MALLTDFEAGLTKKSQFEENRVQPLVGEETKITKKSEFVLGQAVNRTRGPKKLGELVSGNETGRKREAAT